VNPGHRPDPAFRGRLALYAQGGLSLSLFRRAQRQPASLRRPDDKPAQAQSFPVRLDPVVLAPLMAAILTWLGRYAATRTRGQGSASAFFDRAI